MERWREKISVVTGASAGIGLEIAKALIREGVQVVGLARRREKMEEEMRNLTGAKGKFYAVQCDVTNAKEVEKAFKWIDDNLGKIQLLINNAGTVHFESLSKLGNDKIKNVVDVNLMGTVWCSKEAIKIMLETKLDSYIINLNSVVGHHFSKFGAVEFNIYPATKHAITGLSETLRQELQGQNIRVTSISPGLVKTDLIHGGEIPIEWNMPYMIPKDIADAIIFILSTPLNVQITELTLESFGKKFIAQ